MLKHVIAFAAAGAMVAGCVTTDPVTGQRDVNRTATNAIIGAVVGAGAGTLAGGNDRRNAVIGAGIGALAGAAVGAYMDKQEAAMRERLRGTGVGVTRTAENEILLNMPADITFAFNRADVQPQFRGTISSVAQTLREYPNSYVDVVGHADSVGTDAYNLDLSQRRANSVAQLLAAQGVQQERLLASGRGESQPVADNATDAGRAQNRRVEIRVRAVEA